jgi:hypothetical protein
MTWTKNIQWALIAAAGWFFFTCLLMLFAYSFDDFPRGWITPLRCILPILALLSGTLLGVIVGKMQRAAAGSAEWLGNWPLVTAISWGICGPPHFELWNLLFYYWTYDQQHPRYMGALSFVGIGPWILYLGAVFLSTLGQLSVLSRISRAAFLWPFLITLAWLISAAVSWTIYEFVFRVQESLVVQAVVLPVGAAVFGAVNLLALSLVLLRVARLDPLAALRHE